LVVLVELIVDQINQDIVTVSYKFIYKEEKIILDAKLDLRSIIFTSIREISRQVSRGSRKRDSIDPFDELLVDLRHVTDHLSFLLSIDSNQFIFGSVYSSRFDVPRGQSTRKLWVMLSSGFPCDAESLVEMMRYINNRMRNVPLF